MVKSRLNSTRVDVNIVRVTVRSISSQNRENRRMSPSLRFTRFFTKLRFFKARAAILGYDRSPQNRIRVHANRFLQIYKLDVGSRYKPSALFLAFLQIPAHEISLGHAIYQFQCQFPNPTCRKKFFLNNKTVLLDIQENLVKSNKGWLKKIFWSEFETEDTDFERQNHLKCFIIQFEI